MLDYEENKRIFDNYISDCRKRIVKEFFSDEEIQRGLIVQKNDEYLELIPKGLSVNETIIAHRNRLIDIKLNHTMRVVEDVSKMASKIGTPINFNRVLKVAALLHDIARFEQAIENFDFIDKQAVNMEGMYHAQYGHKMLVANHGFDYYDIPKKYQYAVAQTVLHHQDANIPKEYQVEFDDASSLDADKFLTGNDILNEQETIIVAAILQMVKDVDMLDILYQHLTGEFNVVNPNVYFKLEDPNNPGKKMTLEEVGKRFDVEPNIIKEYNNLTSNDISNLTRINVPVKHINPAKLVVPMDIQERFFNNEIMDLRELQARQDWTFIIGMWWRLNKFLNSITFLSNLELIEEKDLLEKIYNQYPEELKPLVANAFEFAQENLVEKTVKENKDRIYISR